MTVRCKYKVDSIERIMSSKIKIKLDGSYGAYVPAEMRTVKMSPVYGNGDPNHENTKLWTASPSGRFELGTINLDAAEQFELGKEYYIDITPAR